MAQAVAVGNGKLAEKQDQPSTFVLGVDLDGVCADFDKGLRPIAAEWLCVSQESLHEAPSRDYPEWGLDAAGGFDALYRYAATRRNLFKMVPPVNGASLALRRLDAQKHIRIRIITHRLYFEFFHALMVQQTIDWLDKYDFPYWDLCFMKDKAAVGADLYIEDSVSNMKALRKAKKDVIVFATSQNVELGKDRAQNWDEVEQRVLDVVGKWDHKQTKKQPLAGH
jgi:5'(3')-deoxyribonucleotidase